MKIVLSLLCFALMAAPVPAVTKEPDQLFHLVGERLELMNQVAAHKWHRQLGIEDTEREQLVLDQASTTALRAGITVASSNRFFKAQIEAAKEIQQYWFTKWHQGEDVPAAPDLDRVIRPQLIELGNRIIDAIATTGPLHDGPWRRQQFNDAVNTRGLSAASRARLYDALIDLAFYPDRLDQILASGELRIGTTGDYAPFSYIPDNGPNDGFQGIDIDLARDLAASLDLNPVFVQTSWPTLMQDLADDRFDIGMSGISRTLSRQTVAFFSLPYHEGGKTPIARCEDAGKFNGLNKIDTPRVRVIVNPGGTNSQFVKQHIHSAEVRIFEDNRTIFDEIAAGRADVMITDAIEVKLKAAQYPLLCATMPGETFTYQEKAYLMPRTSAFKEYVDTWLSLRIGDGTVQKTFHKHLNAAAGD